MLVYILLTLLALLITIYIYYKYFINTAIILVYRLWNLYTRHMSLSDKFKSVLIILKNISFIIISLVDALICKPWNCDQSVDEYIQKGLATYYNTTDTTFIEINKSIKSFIHIYYLRRYNKMNVDKAIEFIKHSIFITLLMNEFDGDIKYETELVELYPYKYTEIHHKSDPNIIKSLLNRDKSIAMIVIDNIPNVVVNNDKLMKELIYINPVCYVNYDSPDIQSDNMKDPEIIRYLLENEFEFNDDFDKLRYKYINMVYVCEFNVYQQIDYIAMKQELPDATSLELFDAVTSLKKSNNRTKRVSVN